MRGFMWRKWRPWGAGLLVLTLVSGVVACENSEGGAATAVDDSASGAPDGMVEACRAARNMLDANAAANLTFLGGEDEELRRLADSAAADFYALANQVDDDEFVEWTARVRFSNAESRQFTKLLRMDPDFGGGAGILERSRESVDEVHHRCRDQAGVNIRRDQDLIDEYRISP